MFDERDNFKDDYLTPLEAHRVASNLDRIEFERERINNPTVFDRFVNVLAGIVAFPFIIFVAWYCLRGETSFLWIIGVILVAIVALYLDILFVAINWKLIKDKKS